MTHKTMKSALREIKTNLAAMNNREGKNDPKRWAVLEFGAIMIGHGDSPAHRELKNIAEANEYLS